MDIDSLMDYQDKRKPMSNDFDIKIPKIKAPKITPPKTTNIKISDPFAPWFGKEKEKIPPKTRKAVWEEHFGNRKTGKCYVCGRAIQHDNFHCAHKKAAANGGSIRKSNLVPTCMACNLKMGTQNLEAYKRKNHPSKPDKATTKKTTTKTPSKTAPKKPTTKTTPKSSTNKGKKRSKSNDPWDFKFPKF